MSDVFPLKDDQVSEHERETCYAGLPEETIHSLEQRVQRIKGIAAQSMMEVGQELAAAKAEIEQGQGGGFQTWVKAKLGITEQYAYQLIAVYEQFAKLKGKLSLPLSFANTALRLLAAPSVPQEVREEALQLAEKGVNITAQQAKELIETKRAQIQAEEAAQLAQRRLAEEQIRSQEEISRLTQRITGLQEEIAALSQPEVTIREVEKEVLPPEVVATLGKLQAKIQALTDQRNNLALKVQQLGTDLETLREAREAEREQELRAIQIRQHWQKAADTFRQNVLKLLGQFPAPLDTEVFESEDWERLAQVKAVAHRFLDECDHLTVETRLMIVDSE